MPGQAGGCGAATIGAMCGPFLKPSEWVYMVESIVKKGVCIFERQPLGVGLHFAEAGRFRVFGPGAVIL